MVTYATSSDEAMQKATGKVWNEWLTILDKAGAAKWPHAKIAVWVWDNYKLSSEWWAQQITTGYEQARSKRALYQRADGTYSASASKTFAAPQEVLFEKFCHLSEQDWLPFEIKIVHKNFYKRVSAHGPDDTRIIVNFLAKDAQKATVQVEHQKLRTPEDRERFAAAWRQALAVLA